VQLENIIGVIQGIRETTDIIYDLFLGEKRAIAAMVLYFSDLTDLYEKDNSRTLLFGNMPIHGQIKRRSLKLMAERREIFKNKTLEGLLALHKANIEIVYDNVISVTIKKGVLSASLEFVVRDNLRKKLSFSIERRQIAEVESLINKLLPSKVK